MQAPAATEISADEEQGGAAEQRLTELRSMFGVKKDQHGHRHVLALERWTLKHACRALLRWGVGDFSAPPHSGGLRLLHDVRCISALLPAGMHAHWSFGGTCFHQSNEGGEWAPHSGGSWLLRLSTRTSLLWLADDSPAEGRLLWLRAEKTLGDRLVACLPQVMALVVGLATQTEELVFTGVGGLLQSVVTAFCLHFFSSAAERGHGFKRRWEGCKRRFRACMPVVRFCLGVLRFVLEIVPLATTLTTEDVLLFILSLLAVLVCSWALAVTFLQLLPGSHRGLEWLTGPRSWPGRLFRFCSLSGGLVALAMAVHGADGTVQALLLLMRFAEWVAEAYSAGEEEPEMETADTRLVGEKALRNGGWKRLEENLREGCELREAAFFDPVRREDKAVPQMLREMDRLEPGSRSGSKKIQVPVREVTFREQNTGRRAGEVWRGSTRTLLLLHIRDSGTTEFDGYDLEEEPVDQHNPELCNISLVVSRSDGQLIEQKEVKELNDKLDAALLKILGRERRKPTMEVVSWKTDEERPKTPDPFEEPADLPAVVPARPVVVMLPVQAG